MELPDSSISTATSQKISYFGYEFDIPWNDVDPSQTKLYPKVNPCKVLITFRSGLRLSFTTVAAKEYVNGLASMSKVSPQGIEAAFGVEESQSDYAFLKRLYEFTPEKMNYWSLSPAVHYRESMLLTIKSISLLSWAKGGIFNVQSSPQVHPTGFAVNLYSHDGSSVEFLIDQKHYKNPAEYRSLKSIALCSLCTRLRSKMPRPPARRSTLKILAHIGASSELSRSGNVHNEPPRNSRGMAKAMPLLFLMRTDTRLRSRITRRTVEPNPKLNSRT